MAALNDALLKHIIKPSAKVFKKMLAFNAIETAVNLGASFAGPLGQIPDLAMRGYKLSQLEKEAGEAADRQILYVRDYCEAVDRWCVAAQHLINRLQASAANLP